MTKGLTPTALRVLLERYGLRPKKSLGQHFLWKSGIVEKIVDAAEIDKDDVVVEIGPGLGILTTACARRAGLVIGIELDQQLFPVLEEILCEFDNVRLIPGNALEVDFDELAAGFSSDSLKPYKVLGNLPYYLSSPLLLRLLEGNFRAELFVFMLQREVAERLVARPGGKNYGSLSVVVQYYAEPELLFTVSRDAFYPPPQVSSAVVRLRKRSQPPVEVDESVFFQVVRAAFRYRRKTLRNALLEGGLLEAGVTEEVFQNSGIEPSRRGESLSLAEFAAIANALACPAKRR
ncbi:MAG: Ribosomal RNA small subunit methyltransferase A [Thermoanaerobacterales bacterium 50_218]|nr:MAG: Ribosomal RNA small subunit methyltransferase A [Thermoanaerobacterales bacterium 50_218]HAA89748.1 16S rRNA (adenine(1518)-N(6)/adenine(1519)-N(6))-dimethyltransferase [Peptococcaceae bacterium]